MKLALGTAQFGFDYGIANSLGHVSIDEVARILELAKNNGIVTLDTAAAYGTSEKTLGTVGVDGFEVISKIPPIPSNISDIGLWVKKTLYESLDHLKRSRIKGVLFHRPLELMESNGENLYKALIDLKEEGCIEKIGASIYGPQELEVLLSKFDFDVVQAPLNIFDTRLISSGWLEKLNKQNIEVHTRSTFLQGLLLMDQDRRSGYFTHWDSIWNIYHSWLKEEGISALEACLRFACNVEGINKVIVGVDSKVHLMQIIKLASKSKIDIPPELISTDENLINPALWKL